jgi:hypothetical protein
MTSDWIIWLGGAHALAFAVFHGFFWRLFDWKNDLRKLSLANRAIMQIANLRLIYFFLMVAFICFFFSGELSDSRLGQVFLLGLSLFWLGRLVEQFIFLRVNHRLAHALSLAFALGTALFALPLLF